MRRFIASLITFAALLGSYAQATSQWQVIKHSQFNLIFNADIESEAQRTAALLDHYLAIHNADLPTQRGIKPIDIVLLNDSHQSNGFVGIPYRSVWYNKPDVFAQGEWLDTLAVHEGRHIVQFNKANDESLSQTLSFLFGDVGIASFALRIPDWFLEGDAVISETIYTEGGRGRMASFDLWMRTDALYYDAYPFNHALLGTGFDRLPWLDYYLLGYYLTGYLQERYGLELFNETLERLAAGEWATFNSLVRQQTGLSLDEHYANMMVELTDRWQAEVDALTLTKTDLLVANPIERWVSHYPVHADETGIIALEIDVEQGQRLVRFDGQQRTVLTDIPRDVSSSYMSGSKAHSIAFNNDQFCWVRDYSTRLTSPKRSLGDIECWQPASGFTRLTHGDKLTSVASANNDWIAHRFTATRDSQLVWFTNSGTKKRQVDLPKRSLAYDIQVSDQGVVFGLMGSDSDGLYWLATDSDTPKLLVAAEHETLRSPRLTDHWLLYTSDRSGIDQLMAQSLANGQAYQIATRPHGAYFPFWQADQQRIVFSDYSRTGQRLSAVSFIDSTLSQADWIPASNVSPKNLHVASLIQRPAETITAQFDYAVEPYRVTDHLWNPRIWWAQIGNEQIRGNLHSLDSLGTLSLNLNAGFDYGVNEFIGGFQAQLPTDVGPIFGLAVQREVGATQWQTQVSALHNQQRGTSMTQWQPSLAFGQEWLDGFNADSQLIASLVYQTQQHKAIQAIETPFGLRTTMATRYSIQQQTVDALVGLDVAFAGWQPRHALNASVTGQWLESNGSPLIASSAIFGDANGAELTTRMAADYRMNLGANGDSLGSWLFWRNSELSFNVRSQVYDDSYSLALGTTFQPNTVLFRNRNIVFSPSASIYYLPASDELRFTWQAAVANF